MTPLHEQATPVIKALVGTFLEVLPEHWTSGLLEIRDIATTDGTIQLSHAIRNEEGERDLAQPDDRVFEATKALFDLFRAHDEPWRGIDVRVRWLPEEEKWDYRIAFDYSQEVQAAIARKYGK